MMSLDFSLESHPRCPTCGSHVGWEIYTENYTHNGIPMWSKAGVYEALYESEGRQAKDILESLEKGVKDFEARFSEYEKLNSPNGWGLAKHALPFLKRVTEACRKNPEAFILVSR